MPKKPFAQMTPREVESYLRGVILRLFGDELENKSTVTARHGRYNITVALGPSRSIAYSNFRKTQVPQVVKSLRYFVEKDGKFD